MTFEDCFAEPDGAHSADCVWKCAYKCFEGGKNLLYMILTFLCAIPAALYWGCLFAKVAFTHIWCITPGLALLEINCGVMKKLFTDHHGMFLGSMLFYNGPVLQQHQSGEQVNVLRLCVS